MIPQFHTGKHRVKYIPQVLLSFCSYKQKFPGPELKFNIHLKGMETFHPYALEVFILWTSNEFHTLQVSLPQSLKKKNNRSPWRRDDFHQGKLAACHTGQMKESGDEKIHKIAFILPFWILQKFSVGNGLQRMGCTNSPLSFQNIPGPRER